MKSYVKKPIHIKAVQMTEEMLSGLNLPHGVYVIRGTFYLDTLEGPHTSKPGAWYVQGPFGDNWFIQDNIFKETYEEVT